MLNNKVSKAVRLAIVFGAVSSAAFSASSFAAEENDGVEKVERIQVTGSRIRRTDLEGSIPVTVIERAAIDMSGQTSFLIYYVIQVLTRLVHSVLSLVALLKVFHRLIYAA